MSNRIFDPGPKTYNHLIDRLSRRLDLKYKDHSTALTFDLKGAPPVSGEHEQEALFAAAPLIQAPQEEMLFSPDEVS